MGWFGKKKKKEDEDFSFDDNQNNLGLNELDVSGGEQQPSEPNFAQNSSPQAFNQQQSFQQRAPHDAGFSAYSEGGGGSWSKEFEVLSSKIDTLKAMMESISQRLSNVERKLYEEEKRNRLW
jgi:hypothetical protein